MIKLLIKQGPFYISSFTALFLAMHQTGWLDRIFPEMGDADMAPIFDGGPTFSGDVLFFTDAPQESLLYQEWWFVLTVLVLGTIVFGYIAKIIWGRIFE